MKKHLVDFEQMEWISPAEGIRYKAYEKNGKTIRLMELSDQFADSDWCRHGHVAYIIDGRFQVRFEDHTEHFVKGDTVFIPAGAEHKHVACVPKGERLTMLSFEL